MARVCDICEKRTHVGGSIARRGLPKRKGGVGLKTTGHTKRKYFPNLQKIQVQEGKGVKRMTVCTRCIKSGRIKKPIRAQAS
ncbi:MAG: 50S ribosomal protein L28 [Planctomycetes bacterium]|nr:50S ribosomal protein L28 [Planctomycetota bacterium]